MNRGTAGFGCGCEAYSENDVTGKVVVEVRIIIAGVMPSLPNAGCIASKQPMHWPVNPLRGKPPTGAPCAGDPPARFGGGRGRTQSALPTPIEPPPRSVRGRCGSWTGAMVAGIRARRTRGESDAEFVYVLVRAFFLFLTSEVKRFNIIGPKLIRELNRSGNLARFAGRRILDI